MLEVVDIGAGDCGYLSRSKSRVQVLSDDAPVFFMAGRLLVDSRVLSQKLLPKVGDRRSLAPKLALVTGVAPLNYVSEPYARSGASLLDRHRPMESNRWSTLLAIAGSIKEQIDAPASRGDLARKSPHIRVMKQVGLRPNFRLLDEPFCEPFPGRRHSGQVANK
jgi:hypothetical protein